MTIEIILAVLVVAVLIAWRLDHTALTKWWDSHTTPMERADLGHFVSLIQPLAHDAVAYILSVSPAADAADVFIQAVARTTKIIEADYGPVLKSLTTLIENAVASAVQQHSAKPPVIQATAAATSAPKTPPAS